MTYLYLFSTIICEVIGTIMLKSSDGFTKLWASVVVVMVRPFACCH
ncbi:Multidrug transporter EmrE [Poriferisphaera corsica]|uniref:Multidrug transporter EmrE n=1 Tax=Poriferisphaera corsica TaxID=2528020 RepID=A0A517YUX9_9BACT|nr:Multidrug transporter EmrE [Poriferisphaera corsica]